MHVVCASFTKSCVGIKLGNQEVTKLMGFLLVFSKLGSLLHTLSAFSPRNRYLLNIMLDASRSCSDALAEIISNSAESSTQVITLLSELLQFHLQLCIVFAVI
jgi:hypothetical protein